MIKKVCHVTSVHKPTDARIFERECVSLTKVYDVTLIAPNVEDYEKNGVHVRGVNLPKSRLKRQRCLKMVYKKMVEVDADVYHFHDPELIPLGLKIKNTGKKVVFDSHENVPGQILLKTYIPTTFFRKCISNLYALYERKSLRRYDALVSVTPEIVNRLLQINPNTYMLTNFPIYKEMEDHRTWERKIGFAGLINHTWKLAEILDAIKDMNVTFELAGPCGDDYLNMLRQHPSWKKVNYHGVISHENVFKMLQSCSMGMAVSSNTNPNGGYRKGSIGVTKIFEYMMIGVPVIATDKDIWKEIVESNECGYCIDCDNIEQIRDKIQCLLDNKGEAERLGNNGIQLVKSQYCWQNQEYTLFEMYSKLFN